MHPKVEELLKRPQYEQRSPEWFAVRENLLTASDAAAALDVKPYASFAKSARAELMKKKVSPEEHPFSTIYTAHGVKYEDEARMRFEAKEGIKVIEFGLLLHPQHPWLGASPDGITEDGKAVEIKCPVTRLIVPGHVPEHYMPQIQVQLEVCDLEECAFVQYKPGDLTWPDPEQFDVVWVRRDREWFETNLPRLRSFWEEMTEAKKAKKAGGRDPPPPPPKKPRAPPKPKPSPECLIRDDLYQPVRSPTARSDGVREAAAAAAGGRPGLDRRPPHPQHVRGET